MTDKPSPQQQLRQNNNNNYNNSPTYARYGSGGGGRGGGGCYKYDPPREDTLRRLNIENKNRGGGRGTKKGYYNNNYNNNNNNKNKNNNDDDNNESYYDRSRKKLSSSYTPSTSTNGASAPQIEKSCKKVDEWMRSNIKAGFDPSRMVLNTMPQSFWDNDKDPGLLFLDPSERRRPTVHPPRGGAGGGMRRGRGGSGARAEAEAVGEGEGGGGTDNEDEHVLTGEYFSKYILPRAPVLTAEDQQPRDMSMKDWLKKRDEKLQERDRLRKWMKSWQQPEEVPMPKEELIKIWQNKRKEYTEMEWIDIEEMPDNQKLSTNQLLELYRKETKIKEPSKQPGSSSPSVTESETPHSGRRSSCKSCEGDPISSKDSSH